MMKVFFIFLLVSFCNAGQARSSSTDIHELRSELKKLRQLSGDVEVQLPSRSPALPPKQPAPRPSTTTDEVSLTQSALQRPLSPEDQELMQMDLEELEDEFEDELENKTLQKRERPAGTPLYRGR